MCEFYFHFLKKIALLDVEILVDRGFCVCVCVCLFFSTLCYPLPLASVIFAERSAINLIGVPLVSDKSFFSWCFQHSFVFDCHPFYHDVICLRVLPPRCVGYCFFSHLFLWIFFNLHLLLIFPFHLGWYV